MISALEALHDALYKLTTTTATTTTTTKTHTRTNRYEDKITCLAQQVNAEGVLHGSTHLDLTPKLSIHMCFSADG